MTPESRPPAPKKNNTTLIVLLVMGGLCVVSIPMIAIIAAIAIPNLLRSRMAANEAAAIGACKTFSSAEEVYQATDYDGDGVMEYAPTLKELGAKSLVTPAMANAESSQPVPIPKAGYFFKVMTGQGANAPGGATSYMKGNNMTVGYALLAYPAQYDSTGRNCFIINQTGTVYQNDLGPNTSQLAQSLTAYDPSNWVESE